MLPSAARRRRRSRTTSSSPPARATGGDRVLTEAGTATLLRAPASAARWFSAALRLLPADAPDEQRVGLLVSRARALAALGRLGRQPRRPAGEHRARPERAAGDVLRRHRAPAGPPRGGPHAPAVSLEQLPDPAAPEAIALMIELAVDAMFRAQPEAVRDGPSARSGGRELGDGPLIASAASMLALGHSVAGASPEAEAAYAEAAALVAGLSDAELGTRIDSARLPLFRGHVPGPLRRGLRATASARSGRPCRRPPASDAAAGARRRAPDARPPRRRGQGPRRRRRSGAAGRDHAEPGVDAAQPLVAVGGLRRPLRSARAGRGGAGADRPARRERPHDVGGDVRRPRGRCRRRQPAAPSKCSTATCCARSRASGG